MKLTNPSVNFPSQTRFVSTMLPSFSKEASLIYQSALNYTYSIPVSFDLWMSSGAQDIFPLWQTCVTLPSVCNPNILHSFVCIEQRKQNSALHDWIIAQEAIKSLMPLLQAFWKSEGLNEVLNLIL